MIFDNAKDECTDTFPTDHHPSKHYEATENYALNKASQVLKTSEITVSETLNKSWHSSKLLFLLKINKQRRN